MEVTSPPRFDRAQLALRIVLAIVLAWLGITAGWLVGVLYGVLPLFAAIAISSIGRDRYLQEAGPRMWRVLAWLLQLSSFMILLVDRFPAGGEHPVRIEIRCTGNPTVGSALARLVTSIPSGFVLCVLGFVSSVLWLIAALLVLIGGTVSPSILGFQRGVLRWAARLVAYHASLVEEYPPFSFDTGDGQGTPLAAAGAR
ncbi:MAG TPA: DUF4389 domain-containing protein [Kofleriaceae bacterium]|nr:DUF4389 domain-containing protein [Kofleriaceae bacterium]